ncbi:50S ribosomal protein L3 [Malacoplasma muris]|uniref:50S ribosomal protein L3 n=1 Tax=Malacoplasma muris TaxID=2119 RepID=UPI00398EDEAD
MKMLLGKKVGMTQVFLESGKVIPVTVIHVEPNVVLENKTKDKNGYVSTKVGFVSVEERVLNKPKQGYFKKIKQEPKRFIKEFRDVDGYNVGDKLTVSTFKAGDKVDVQAISKGHGFTGAIKRWNFKVGPLGHGAGYPHRYQGSISFGRGGSQGQRVMKGKKMSGHWGNELITIANLTVISIDAVKNLILIHGSVPGPNDGVVCIKTTSKKTKFIEPLKLCKGKVSEEAAIQEHAQAVDTSHEAQENKEGN